MGHKFLSDLRARRAERRTDRRRALIEAQEDACDLAVVAERMAADNGTRLTLDEAIDRLGFTRDELDGLEDEPG